MSLDKIAKLLRLAERASTPAEAEAFFTKAQELATRESVDLAIARAHTEKTEARTKPVIEHIEIGEPRTKGLGTYCSLFMAIGEANNLKFTIALNSTSVTAYGFPEDIAVTREIYNTVLPQMVKESDAYVRSDERKAQIVFAVDDWMQARPKRLHGSTARLNFQQAYARRIGRRLREAKVKIEQQIIADTADVSNSTAVAIRDSQMEVQDFFAVKTKHIRRAWGGSRTSAPSDHARNAGRAAANAARLGTERRIAATSHSRGAL